MCALVALVKEPLFQVVELPNFGTPSAQFGVSVS